MSRKAYARPGAVGAAVKWAAKTGNSLPDAAKRFDVTRAAVWLRWRRDYGAELTPTQVAEAAWEAEVLSLVESGYTVIEISQQTGINAATVRVICKRLKLMPRPGRDERKEHLEAALAQIVAGEPASEVAAKAGLTDGYLRNQSVKRGIRPARRSWVERRDGRSLRAALLVEAGMSVKEACAQERASAPYVYVLLKRRKGLADGSHG